MADHKKYKIFARPSNQSVSPGAVVDYICAQQYDVISAPGKSDEFAWYCFNDRTTNRAHKAPLIVDGPKTVFWKNAKWAFPGLHTIRCEVKFTDGVHYHYSYPQRVEPTEAILGRELTRAQKGRANPESVLQTIKRYINLLERMPVDPSAKSRHEEQIAGYKQYLDKLDERLSSTKGWVRFPISAVHIETASQRKSTLKVFIAQPRFASVRGDTFMLVDWTNPLDRSRTDEYKESGRDAEEVVRKLIKAWDSGNRYYDGTLAYEIPFYVAAKDIKDQFSTDGKSFWDSVSDFFDWVALGGAVVAGVVTLVAPVPGSRVVSAAIWTAIFSSTTAAVINIGQRHWEGFGNWKDDAFDGLTILGNIFAGGTMVWAKRGAILAKNAQGQTVKYFLVGQIGTDSVQGVLIAADHIKKYDEIMSDKTLTPDERSKKLLELFGSLTLAGVMTFISVKATKADLKHINEVPKHVSGKDAKSPARKLEELKNPKGEPLDTTKQPKVEGHTDNGRMKTSVQEEQLRAATRAQKAVVRASRKLTNGIPIIDLKEGKILVLGLYGDKVRNISLRNWIKRAGNPEAKLVTNYSNPLKARNFPENVQQRFREQYQEPAAGFYQGAPELSVNAIKWVRKLEPDRLIIFDLNGVNVKEALTRGSTNYNKVTSHELRYIKENWNEVGAVVVFYENGRKASRPW